MVLLGLFNFGAWFVPLLAAAVIGISPTSNNELALTILALSPLPGIAISSGLYEAPVLGAIQLAALTPPITFAFAFKYLLVVAQRKIDRVLRETDKAPAPVAPFELSEQMVETPT